MMPLARSSSRSLRLHHFFFLFEAVGRTAKQELKLMFHTMTNISARNALLVAALFATAAPAFAQAPTDAQKSAIRSACRSDYQAHCASVPPGGEASLQCLQKNMSSLSSACQSAVRAIEPKAESAPATEPAAKPAATTEAPATTKSTRISTAPFRTGISEHLAYQSRTCTTS